MDRHRSDDGAAANEEADEQRFLSIFSKQLAEALRVKEEEEAEERERLRVSSSASRNNRSFGRDDETKQWERIQTTYVELCHDDPIISGGDGDCRRLARELIPRHNMPKKVKGAPDANRLSLSSRLVDGILQATSRVGAKAVASSSASTDTTQEKKSDESAEKEPLFGSSNVTTSEGYAEIAFAVFIEGPYRCIQQADDLHTASKFLGSFVPPETTTSASANDKLAAEEKSRLADEAAAKMVKGLERMGDDASSSSSEFFHQNAATDAQQRFDDNNDSMEEVFAEESDDSDFDYGSSYNPYSSNSDVQTIFGQKATDTSEYDNNSCFDPLQLSKINATNQTWEGARKSIHYFLSSASYGKLALGSLSSRAWSEGGMSETLADLSFMLLLEHTNRDQEDAANSNSLLHRAQHDSEESGDVVALWDRPLFLLRDRALDKNRGHDALPSYLQLLTAFLSHSGQDITSILSSPMGKSTAEDMLSPMTRVGLSSLATMCSSKEMTSASSGRMCGTSVWGVCPREEMKKVLLSSLDSLAHIVECVRPRKSIQGGGMHSSESPWIRTVVCIIPIVEYLTNLQARFDFQPVFEGGGSRSAALSNSDAKAISDSGLFRELLSIYTTTSSMNDTSSAEIPNAVDVVRMQLLRTIFTLSAQSSEVLGKYAVRVPDLVKEVHSSAFMEKNLVDGILWTSIGSSLLENKSETTKPRLKLRANSKLTTNVPLETGGLAGRSMSGFEAMCNAAKGSLEKLNLMNSEAHSMSGHSMSDDEKAEYDACKNALGDIKRFSNCLSNCPSVAHLWLDSLKNKEGLTQQTISHVSQLKSMLAMLPSFPDVVEVTHRGHKKDDDDNIEGAEGDPVSPEDETNQKIQTLKQMQKDYGAIVTSLRSSVKVIALTLESQKGSSGLTVKGPASYDVSSKTD